MKNKSDDYGDIDLRKIFSFLFVNKILISLFTFFFLSLSVLYASLLHNTYKSESVIMPVTDNNSSLNSLGSLVSNFGGLANFTGMNLPNTAQSKTNEIIAVMSSYDFFEQLMLKNDFTIELMAGYGWDEENNKVMIDERIYDVDEEKWLVENYNQKLDKPTMQSTFKVFKQIFEVKYDSDSSFIIVSVEHFSPVFAKNLLDDIIFLTNKIFVDKVISEGEQSISYLTERYEETKLAEIRSTLSNLIQIQTQKVALANSSSESIFKIISSPIIPEEKAGPSRMIIIILGFLIGLFMGIIFSFVKGIVKSSNK